MCKVRAFTELWDELCRDRYGISDEKLRRFRFGVQVNSLGLTEQQPENNVYRILLEMLAVVLSKNARARAVQLPAWNEALGLPRPWDQQWSLRLQQIVAHETDLLEFADLFDGSPVVDTKVQVLKQEAQDELAVVAAMGGAVAAVESGYMKERLVESNARRLAAIESGAQPVVGVNIFTEGAESPLTADEGTVLTVDHTAEDAQIRGLAAWRAERDDVQVRAALEHLERATREGANIMEASIACAHAGATTGEWGGALRQVLGEYRAPTGTGAGGGVADAEPLDALRQRVNALSGRLGRTVTMVIGKPGLDGHSNGAEQIAVRAQDAGMNVVYDGIRLIPLEIVAAAKRAAADVVGLSILSGSHVALVREVIRLMREDGMGDVPVVVGGIIPAADEGALTNMGVAKVYTPKDYDLNRILDEILDLLDRGA
jgi:(2R)-ethylmalonyl-CoA mutase